MRVEWVVLAAAADLGQAGDFIGVIHHVQELMGGMADLAVLLLAVVSRRAVVVVTGDSLAMFSRPFCHLDRSSCSGTRSSIGRGNGGPRPQPMGGS
jgi:hypothetical protein